MKARSTQQANPTYPPAPPDRDRDRRFWGAERLLLVCLLGLGLIGLVMTYSDRVSETDGTSRVQQDSINQNGKARESHMVLPLNKRHPSEQKIARSATQL